MNSGTSSTELNDMLTNFVNYVDSFYGVNVEYFCHEFMETSSVKVHESDYLNIAMFNAMFWEW